jgi:addiction module RelE/StbE family toxin
MIVTRHKNFKKHFKSRVSSNKSLVTRFRRRLEMFLIDPKNPSLKDHKLTGTMSQYRSFWITGDVRLIYRIYNNRMELYDIGSHNQVY